MWIFEIFTNVYRKLKWLFSFIRVYIGPIYNELIDIVKEVSETDLNNEEARKVVFQKITDYIQAKGIILSDSILNLSIEIVYQIVKQGKEQ